MMMVMMVIMLALLVLPVDGEENWGSRNSKSNHGVGWGHPVFKCPLTIIMVVMIRIVTMMIMMVSMMIILMMIMMDLTTIPFSLFAPRSASQGGAILTIFYKWTYFVKQIPLLLAIKTIRILRYWTDNSKSQPYHILQSLTDVHHLDLKTSLSKTNFRNIRRHKLQKFV